MERELNLVMGLMSFMERGKEYWRGGFFLRSYSSFSMLVGLTLGTMPLNLLSMCCPFPPCMSQILYRLE